MRRSMARTSPRSGSASRRGPPHPRRARFNGAAPASPAAWGGGVGRGAGIAAIARRIAEVRPRHVIFTARGTSDHAALYGAYLTEIRLGISAGLASPSAVTIYGARPDFRDCLVVGVSQSGGSPDLS